VFEAWRDHARSSGFKFPHQAYIRKELLKWGKERSASPPSAESLREAYEAYSKDEWTNNLIPYLDRANLRPFLLYLQANKGELTQGRGAWANNKASLNIAEIEGEEEVTQRLPRPSKRRSWMEMAGGRAVAESLGYDPDTMHGQVAKWRKRMNDVPFEKFVEKFGGDWTDYLTWVCNPPLHRKIQSRHKRRGV
jgi:hypothetical protein